MGHRIKNTSYFWIKSCHVPRTAGLYLEEQLPAASWAPPASWCAKGSRSPAFCLPWSEPQYRKAGRGELPHEPSSSLSLHCPAQSLAHWRCEFSFVKWISSVSSYSWCSRLVRFWAELRRVTEGGKTYLLLWVCYWLGKMSQPSPEDSYPCSLGWLEGSAKVLWQLLLILWEHLGIFISFYGCILVVLVTPAQYMGYGHSRHSVRVYWMNK